MSEMPIATKKVNMDQTCRCLFCGNTFPVRDIVFAKNEPNGSSSSLVDKKFEKAMGEYKLIDGDVAVEIPLRRFFTWEEKDVQSTEPGPNGTAIPLTVLGHITKEQVQGTKRKSILAIDEDVPEPGESEKETEITLISTVRLCPHCHMTLPEGFASEEIRRIGLLGGSRCGKTTYMVVACKYMENYLGLLSGGLDLGTVTFLPECDKYLKKLYDSQRRAAGAAATVIDAGVIKEKPVFPIIAHVVPTNRDFKPFYVIIQDIPGEYMSTDNLDKLINSAIPQSTDLISLVDINSLAWTRMQDDDTYGAYCVLEPGELFKNFSMLGNELNKQDKLQSVQLCLTKLDFWLDANPEVGTGTVLAKNGNEEHRGAISDRRLEAINMQVKHRLKKVGNMDQSGLMEVMLRSLNLPEDMNIHKAYTAVASRMVPGNESVFKQKGIDFATSLNVIEPLLNIFSWGNLLPHDYEERVISNPEDPEEEFTEQETGKPGGIFGWLRRKR